MMTPAQETALIKKDYFLITFIGVAFALFAIPILKNLNIGSFKISVMTVVELIVFFGVFANIALWIASLIAKKIPVFLQIAKFAAVGAFNTFLDWGIVNLLMALTQIFLGPWYIVFNCISFIAANSGSYFWNKYWTFSSNGQKSEGSFIQFFSVTLVGLLIKVSVAYGIVSFFNRNYLGHPSATELGRVANIGLVCGTLLALVWNFIGYKFFVFKEKTA